MNKGHVKLPEPLYLSSLYYFSTKIDKFEAYSHQKTQKYPILQSYYLSNEVVLTLQSKHTDLNK